MHSSAVALGIVQATPALCDATVEELITIHQALCLAILEREKYLEVN